MTPRPSPTPIVNRIDVADQTIDETAVFIIDNVVMTEAGWLVVFNERDGEMGEVIGELSLPFGVTDNIEIELDLARVTEVVFIQLYLASDESAESFDAEESAPVSPPVIEEVAIELDIAQPEITVENQTIERDGILRVDSVLSNVAGWIVVHSGDDVQEGVTVGVVQVPEGLSQNVAIPIRWREADDRLRLTLVEDKGRLGSYEPALDTPVMIANETIEANIEVILPIDVVVYDQPSEDGFITVERVISPGDGWLAIYQDDEGSPGLIIGYAPIEAGRNDLVAVEVIESAVTNVLYIILHSDTNVGDEFDLPANDPPFLEGERLITPFAFSTTPRDYLIAMDQPLTNSLGDTGIKISIMKVQVAAWVVVQTTDEAEELVEVISATAVSSGVHRDLFLPVPDSFAGETVVVALYTNSGDPDLFELEEDIDVPIRLNLQPLQLPITIFEP